jgi:hypothetical protein
LSLNIYLLGLLLVTLHKGCSSLLFRCFGNLASNHSRPHSSTLSCIARVEGFRISWRRSRFLCFRSPRSCVRRRFFADPVSSCRSLQILPCRARIWCLAKLPNVFWHTSHAVLQTSSGHFNRIFGSVDAARERRDMACAADFAKTKSHGNSAKTKSHGNSAACGVHTLNRRVGQSGFSEQNNAFQYHMCLDVMPVISCQLQLLYTMDSVPLKL